MLKKIVCILFITSITSVSHADCLVKEDQDSIKTLVLVNNESTGDYQLAFKHKSKLKLESIVRNNSSLRFLNSKKNKFSFRTKLSKRRSNYRGLMNYTVKHEKFEVSLNSYNPLKEIRTKVKQNKTESLICDLEEFKVNSNISEIKIEETEVRINKEIPSLKRLRTIEKYNPNKVLIIKMDDECLVNNDYKLITRNKR